MGILDVIIVVLIIAWIGGFSFHILGSFIHIFLVVALIVLVLRLLGII